FGLAQTNILMQYGSANAGNDYIQKDEVFVTNYNGVLGDNFQVFYREQAADFIVPQTEYYGPDNNGDGVPDWFLNRGSPEAGLTNAQNWEKYHIAIAGAVAPPGTTTVDGIVGLVCKL